MSRALIVTGGWLDMEFAGNFCDANSFDLLYAADKGLQYVHELGLEPDYIIGDFDTVDDSLLHEYEKKADCGEKKFVMERYPVRKDATDTELAVQKAIDMGAGEITLLGATGSRLDHVLANVGLLGLAADKGVKCRIVDSCNRISYLKGRGEYCIPKREQYGTYLSLIPMTPSVTGLTMTGVDYPVNDQTIRQGSSFTVSNRIVGDTAFIAIREGAVLIIESRDE